MQTNIFWNYIFGYIRSHFLLEMAIRGKLDMKWKMYAVIRPDGELACGSENFDGWGGVSGAIFCSTYEDAEKVCKWWNREVESGHQVIQVEIITQQAAARAQGERRRVAGT